jgi:hypothetical protein
MRPDNKVDASRDDHNRYQEVARHDERIEPGQHRDAAKNRLCECAKNWDCAQ